MERRATKDFWVIKNLHVLISAMHTLGPVIVGFVLEDGAEGHNVQSQLTNCKPIQWFCFMQHFYR
jgi:hypothetical protein